MNELVFLFSLLLFSLHFCVFVCFFCLFMAWSAVLVKKKREMVHRRNGQAW
ncbi:hypothetical protein RchiOBHm_Chr6g0252641 [Rosa chinensis]|uniref:Uncharacterized protein n=1 Tax=Rosa chinensis TaxID=74649 RepID=A0A2P6PL49_ROSCH|nr:hypothetical protein RchiOBHm_Chr6g0252641 [Rosa chinensis]